MHSHEVCEQLMTAANRTGNCGRMEYLTARCDATHGRDTPPPADHDEATDETDTTEPEEARA